MNEKFLHKMKDLLQDEYESYIQTLCLPAYRGLRVNTLKVDVNDFLSYGLYDLDATSFCKETFYLDANVEGIGNTPFHIGGLFYMQEPSASSVVEVMDIKKDDWVLDLCAAPGGKSTQIAAKLHHTGFLVSNEIDSGRANILLSNMERMGVSENMITNTYPEKLCEEMHGCFDKVLVDAPCSGEGMFKKNSRAIDEWSEEHVEACSHRQQHILNSAYRALKEQGILVYSTCTYSQEENEHVIYEFMQHHPDMELLDCGVTFGRSGIAYKNLEVTKVRRILPMDKGEGHFIAKMRRTSSNEHAKLKEIKSNNVASYVVDFLKDQLCEIPYQIVNIHDKIYMKKNNFYELKNCKILRQGIMCGEIRKNRLEPHQHFYTAAALNPLRKNIVSLDKRDCKSFLEGNVLNISGYRGFIAVAYESHIIGFGKGDGMVIKNKFPKGLRCKAQL